MEGNKDATGMEQTPYTDLIRKTHHRYLSSTGLKGWLWSVTPHPFPYCSGGAPNKAPSAHFWHAQGVRCATDGLNCPPKNPEHPSELMKPLTGRRWLTSMGCAPCLCLLRRPCSMPGLYDGVGNMGHTVLASSPPPSTAMEKPGPEMTSFLFFFFFFSQLFLVALLLKKRHFFKKYIKQIHFTKMSLSWSHQQEMILLK